MTPSAGALLGLGVGFGLWLIVIGWRGTDTPPRRARTRARWSRRELVRAVAAGCGAVLVAAATGWPAAAILAVAAGWYLPRVIGPDRAHAVRVARLEAIATWAEMLRDTLAAAAGLEQAIIVTAPLVPEAIAPQVGEASLRLQAGERLPAVLRALADELADPTADLVLSALLLAAEQRAKHLGELLGSLADAARDHVAMQLRVHTERAQTRSDVRITVATTIVFALWLAVLDRAYLAPYNDAAGQVVLLVVGGLFAAGFAIMARLARMPEAARLLQKSEEFTKTEALRAANSGLGGP